MQDFETLTMAEIPGTTPREKFTSIVKMKELLRAIAYPRRGTKEEEMTLQDFANLISKMLSLENAE